MAIKKTTTAIMKKVEKPVVIKKVIAKSVAKKTIVPKKVMCKTKTQYTCSKKCQSTDAFWVNNGPVVDSLNGLLDALKSMSDEQYAYHTKREGNDFANWISDCLGDVVCAQDLKKVKTRTGAIRVLSSRCVCK